MTAAKTPANCAENDKLVIINDSTARTFVNEVEHITFSGAVAASRMQQVLYVTERCVFVLTPEGLELSEIAVTPARPSAQN